MSGDWGRESKWDFCGRNHRSTFWERKQRQTTKLDSRIGVTCKTTGTANSKWWKLWFLSSDKWILHFWILWKSYQITDQLSVFLFKTCCCHIRFKPRPNDRNLPTQHIATLLGATCCVRLATVLRCVATCWVLLARVWKWSNLSQQHPTFATCCNRVANARNMLRPTMLRYVVLACCDRLAGALSLSPGQTIATCQRNMSQHCWA